MNSKELIIQRFQDSIAVKEKNISDEALLNEVNAIAEEICQDLNNGETGTLKENDSSETSL